MDNKYMNDLSIVVLSHNRREEIQRTVPSLCHGSSVHGFQLIVVDNASSDGSREILSDLAVKFPQLRLLLNDSNLGVAEGRNTGERLASGNYVLFVDDDTWIDIESIQKLYELMKSRPDIGVLSPRIVQAQTNAVENDHGSEACDVGNFHGACHLVRHSAKVRVGGDRSPLHFWRRRARLFYPDARCRIPYILFAGGLW